MASLIDITPALSPSTPVFPGDTSFQAVRSWTLNDDCPVNVSRLTMSSHAGAHADAPLHYSNNGKSIDQVDLSPYLGRCRVVHLMNAQASIQQAELEASLREIAGDIPPRVLIRTYSEQPADWDPDFTAIDAEAIDWLGKQRVKLIGTDTPSLDPATSKFMDAHHAVLHHDLRILEGLLLDHVAEGDYELIALPLKIAGCDAAPVRAVLRTLS